MNIKAATRRYEQWMRRCSPLVEKHLQDKHARMRKDAFQFFRATYYRWAQRWPEICPECQTGPIVLSVGDLHVDSFGTWRDSEGRLCWGVDDFDEAWPLPYTNDLVRLAASVKVAKKLCLMQLRTRTACDVLLQAYRDSLTKGGCPIVLAERERDLEKLGIQALKTPKNFWANLRAHPAVNGGAPPGARQAFERTFPEPHLSYRVVRREAGLGSLGQQRFVAIAECRGGCIAREAKRLVPSASLWLDGRTSRRQSHYQKAMSSAIRSPDPYQIICKTWLIRRLSPDSNPIKIEELSGDRDEETLLYAMGTEIANVHLGEPTKIRAILSDLKLRKTNWLRDAAKKMAKAFLKEWKEYAH